MLSIGTLSVQADVTIPITGYQNIALAQPIRPADSVANLL